MRVIVKKRFKDRHTGKMHEPGEEFTCNKERFAEICSVDAGLVEEKKAETDKNE